METDESANNVPPLRDELPVVQSDVTYAGVQQQYVGAAEAVAEHCKRYLTREWKHSRTPKGYSAAWKELWGQSSTTSTATTFYTTAGYQAWLGLFLAVYSSRESRSFRTKKLADLEGFPVEVKRWIALELTRTQPDPTVEKAMRNLQARYPVPRQRQTQPDSPSPSPSFESDDEMLVGGLPVGSMLSASSSHRTHYDHASPSGAGECFPHGVTSSILLHTNRRISENGDPSSKETLAITMDFPQRPFNIDCVMQVAIVPNRVSRFAQKLFGVEVETEGSMRYIINPNGTRICPNLAPFTLLDCQTDAITMFDKEPPAIPFSTALISSAYRKEEMRKGKLVVTGCVSLSISGCPDDCATLTLNLELGRASSIKEFLYAIRYA